MRITIGICGLLLAVCAAADSITFNGVSHEDVLVYESDALYYVVHPVRGEVINVPVSNASNVSVVRDRAYRERLMTQYEEARQSQLGGAAAMAQVQSAATAAGGAAGVGATPDPSAGAGAPPGMAPPAGGGSGDPVVITAPEETGLGISLADLQAAVQPMGITLQAAGGTFSGAMPEGPMSVTATGSRTNLRSVTVSVEAPTNQAMTTLPAQMANLNNVFAEFAPWVAEWVPQQQATIMSGGTVEDTRSNVKATLQSSGLNNPQVSVSLSATYVGP